MTRIRRTSLASLHAYRKKKSYLKKSTLEYELDYEENLTRTSRTNTGDSKEGQQLPIYNTRAHYLMKAIGCESRLWAVFNSQSGKKGFGGFQSVLQRRLSLVAAFLRAEANFGEIAKVSKSIDTGEKMGM